MNLTRLCAPLLVAVLLSGCDSYKPEQQKNAEHGTGSAEETYATTLSEQLSRLPQHDVVKFQVSFRRWMTEDEFRRAIAPLGSNIAIDRIRGRLPDGGNGHPYVFSMRGEDPLSHDIRSQLEAWIDRGAEVHKDDLLAQVRDGKFLIAGLVLFSETDDVRDWWQSHLEDVRVVQIIRGDIDEAQHLYLPDETIK